MYAHATWLAQTAWGSRPFAAAPPSRAQVSYDGRTWEELDDYRPAAREEYADDPEPCDGSGEIHFNRSPGREPWNDDSEPCHGCENCEPDDDENDHANGQMKNSEEGHDAR